jgi:type VI protein secretion system component VasK
VEDALDDAFFYESPFPPEVVLEEPKPLRYSAEMIARRRKLRTFVAMVVGVAAVILVMGWGKSRVAVETTQPRSMTVPVSP